MKVLVACEYSGRVREAFRAQGHEAYSCDLLPAEDNSPNHMVGDVRNWIDDSWDLMIAHPPCTYLARSGWHWVNRPDRATEPLMGEPRRAAAIEAAEFFRMLLDAPIPKICVENPRPISHVHLPPSTQTIQPHQFGHPAFKATNLWLKGLAPLVPTRRLKLPEHGSAEWKAWNKVHNMAPGPNRWKDRSRTYTGIARAMATQWGITQEDRSND